MNENKQILFIWPEEEYVMKIHSKIPKRWAYFVEIISFVKNKINHTVKVIDCMDPRYSNGEILSEIATKNYFCVVMVCRFESIVSLIRLSKLIKEVDPKIKILIYGDLSGYIPNFIKRNCNIDAVIRCGDWEMGIVDYINFLDGDLDIADVRGVDILHKREWKPYVKGGYLKDNSWSFPDISSNLFSEKLYLSLAKNELTVSISRGCYFHCKFCSAVSTFGKQDRRKNIFEIIEYIQANKNKVDSFKLFSPTLTCDKNWVKSFCNELIKNKIKVRWCGTTRPDQLDDEEMVKLMSESGCYKIALGVETLDQTSTEVLGKFGDNYPSTVRNSIMLLKKYNIKPRILMMLGIEGQTKENIIYSCENIKKWGGSIRLAAYSPREKLIDLDIEDKVTIQDIIKYDKMTFQNHEIPGIDRVQYLELIFSTDNFLKC